MKSAIVFLAVLAVSAGLYTRYAPQRYPPGVLIHAEPTQTLLQDDAPSMQRAGFSIRALARFELDARVLHKRHYRYDPVASLAPVDLAVGWGPMSDQQVLDQLSISQSNRFFWYEWRNQPPIPQDEITCHSTNMHLIPSNEEMRKKIDGLHAGDLIHLSGLLVEAAQPGMPPWRSSLSRTDSGKGACEIVWVESLEKF